MIGVVRRELGAGVYIRGSTGTTTLNRCLTNDTGNTGGTVTVALNANVNNNVVVGNGVCDNSGCTNTRLKRVIVIGSNGRYTYNEGNY